MLFSLLSLDLILYRVRDELLEVDNILVVGKTVEEVQSKLQRVLDEEGQNCCYCPTKRCHHTVNCVTEAGLP